MSPALRRATESDLDALRALFADAVRTTGPDAYSPEQVDLWAATAGTEAGFRRRLLGAWSVVAADAPGGRLLGFGALDGDRVSGLYVAGDAQRRGVGGALLAAVVAEARRRGVARLRAEASVFSLGLFRRHGFAVVGADRIERRGVVFERSLVELDLAEAPDA